ncbi:7897_t:CDS:2 [Ambispora leptoticha]|uniref:7897_t:CDS:1 n=1 Tax=Ambispora leptoticha TaxID=144679 RepID=A0A9N9FCR6_9GLOM|nr:7897_t:CDS:2 [Ambispora leptoticha]
MSTNSKDSLVIPRFCDTWTPEQRFNLAVICTYVVNTTSWSHNEKEQIFRRTFTAGVYKHLGIENTNEKNVLQEMLKDENNSPDLKLIADSYINADDMENKGTRDIRSEVISDLLVICLGFMPALVTDTEKPQQPSSAIKPARRASVKERLDKLFNKTVEEVEQIEQVVENKVEQAIENEVSNLEISDPDKIKPAEYDARARAILFEVSDYLKYSPSDVLKLEDAMAQQLYSIQQEHEANAKNDDNLQKLQSSANETVTKHDKRKQKLRWLATGVGVIVGATAIGITGGIAAPFVALGLGAITGGLFITSSTLVLITGLFGIAGGGLAGYKMRKRTKGLHEFEFKQIEREQNELPQIPSLYVRYLLDDHNEVTTPWLPTFQKTTEYHDTYALTFDTEILRALGKAFRRFLAEHAVKMAAHEVIKHTVFGLLSSALFLPATVMKAGDLIDNPWALGIDRASKAGLILADVLSERVQGKRPTILVGYSLGALVIWECLQELARREEYGLIDSVILIGAPISAEHVERWELASTVVSRRIVNAYATNDLVLAVVYRMHALDLNVAGLKAVNSPRVENYDVTSYTSGHLGYKEPETLTKILKRVGVEYKSSN